MDRYLRSPEAYYIKKGVEEKEYFLQKYVHHLKIRGLNTPKPVLYDKKKKTMVMAKIHGMSVSDIYGDDANEVPPHVFREIQKIMIRLKQCEILYPDFTGYNFIIDNNHKFWVIDFEHASFCTDIDDPFVLSICDGETRWNEEFM